MENVKKYTHIRKNGFDYEVVYKSYDGLEMSSFEFKDLLTLSNLSDFEYELQNGAICDVDIDSFDKYDTQTLFDLIKSSGLFEDEPETHEEMRLTALQIVNSEIRKVSDIDKYDINFVEDNSEFEPDYIEKLAQDYPDVNYNQSFFIVDYVDSAQGLIAVLNANEVTTYRDLVDVIECP